MSGGAKRLGKYYLFRSRDQTTVHSIWSIPTVHCLLSSALPGGFHVTLYVFASKGGILQVPCMAKRFSMHESESWIGYQLPRVFRLDNEVKIRWRARKGWTSGGWVKRGLVIAPIPVLYEPLKWGFKEIIAADAAHGKTEWRRRIKVNKCWQDQEMHLHLQQ